MVGISTSSFYGKLTTEDAAQKIGELGGTCAEVFLNSFSEYTGKFIDVVGERLKKSNVKFNSVHTLPTQFEPQLFAITNRQRSDAEVFFRQVLEGASKNGCTTYVMHGKPFFKKNVGSFTVDYDDVARTLNHLCAIASEYNMDIALENVHWAMCNNLEFILAMKQRVERLKFTLDIKQAHLSEIGWEEYIAAFSSKLINVHICDYVNKTTCLPGRGEVDFKRLSHGLNGINYRGNVIVEVYDRDYSSYSELAYAVEYCKGFFED